MPEDNMTHAEAKAFIEANPPVLNLDGLEGEAATLAQASYDASMVTHNEELVRLQALIDAE